MEPKKINQIISIELSFLFFQGGKNHILHLSSSCEGPSWRHESASSPQSLWTRRAAARGEKKKWAKTVQQSESFKVTRLHSNRTAPHLDRLPRRHRDWLLIRQTVCWSWCSGGGVVARWPPVGASVLPNKVPSCPAALRPPRRPAAQASPSLPWPVWRRQRRSRWGRWRLVPGCRVPEKTLARRQPQAPSPSVRRNVRVNK